MNLELICILVCDPFFVGEKFKLPRRLIVFYFTKTKTNPFKTMACQKEKEND